MQPPKATIRYIADLKRRATTEICVHADSAIELTLVTMRKCRELNGQGALILWVDFHVGEKPRRHYPSGRRGAHGQRKYRTGS